MSVVAGLALVVAGLLDGNGAATKTDDEPAIDPTADATAPSESAADADAVSADEIAALTAGDAHPAAPATTRTLHLGATAGIGIASRSFDPSPSTVTGYASSPVVAVVVEARIQPIARMALSVATERTLQLTTRMRDGSLAATTISRWEAGAEYAVLQRDSFELGPRLGAGRRAFSIDATDPARSPDGDYNYLIVGIAGTAYVAPRISVRGNASFEPVIFGNEPTEMAFGAATRWAIDFGAAVDVRLWSHVFARVAAQYQRFTWSWDMAGARGAGGAVDEYPSGAISIGADY